jgi:F420-non-reducing hydrogenase large subunit
MKSIVVNPITRIEGHASITLDLDDNGKVSRGHLKVLEIRGFEKLLEGMELMKMPLITGRICGVCPAAHHLASVTAIENGIGVEVPEAAAKLRDLMYMGHILHSHALSTFVLTGPDLFEGLDAPSADRNVFSMLRLQPDLVRKVLRLRSIGQKIVEIVGGRGVHPVTLVPGGIASAPGAEEMASMAEWGNEAAGIVEELSGAVFSRLGTMADARTAMEMPFKSLALSNNGSVSFFGAPCSVMGNTGKTEASFPAEKYAENLVEHTMEGSYMKSVRLSEGDSVFFVGPLARLNINSSFTTPRADTLLAGYRQRGLPRTSALDCIEARLIEMVHCAEKIHSIASGGVKGELCIPVIPGAGRFVGMVEAPRGILIHDFDADDRGKVTGANLIVATQGNYEAMDHCLTAMAELNLESGNENLLMNGMEFALRCFDPCLACATHTSGSMPMVVHVRRDGRILRTLSRRMES